MPPLLIQAFFILGTYASLLSMILIYKPAGQPLSCLQWILSGVATLFLLSALAHEFWTYFRRRPLSFGPDDQRKINRFMHRWIARGGRVAIFSHDLTWVDDQMKALLLTKAERNELEIVVPRSTGALTPLLDELRQRGARIYLYPELQYTPKSRFTIVNRGRTGPRVAVGRGVGENWRIDIFSEGEDPVFSVANDLVEVIVNLERMRQRQGG